MGSNWTSVCVRRGTLEKLREAKPYDSLSYDEWLSEIVEKHGGGPQ